MVAERKVAVNLDRCKLLQFSRVTKLIAGLVECDADAR